MSRHDHADLGVGACQNQMSESERRETASTCGFASWMITWARFYFDLISSVRELLEKNSGTAIVNMFQHDIWVVTMCHNTLMTCQRVRMLSCRPHAVPAAAGPPPREVSVPREVREAREAREAGSGWRCQTCQHVQILCRSCMKLLHSVAKLSEQNRDRDVCLELIGWQKTFPIDPGRCR